MKQIGLAILLLSALSGGGALAATADVGQEAKGKTCTMEKQCRWENFKKICVYVKVCR